MSSNIGFLRLRQDWTRSVLREQERLREKTGVVSPEHLAAQTSIMAACQHKQRIAHLRGVQDAHAVYGSPTTDPAGILFQQHQTHVELREKRRSKSTERRKETAALAVVALVLLRTT